MRNPIRTPQWLRRALGASVLATVAGTTTAAGVEFSDAPIPPGQKAQPMADLTFRVKDAEDAAVKKRREQSEDLRSSCRKDAALTAKTELGVRVLLEECEREHRKRLGE